MNKNISRLLGISSLISAANPDYYFDNDMTPTFSEPFSSKFDGTNENAPTGKKSKKYNYKKGRKNGKRI